MTDCAVLVFRGTRTCWENEPAAQLGAHGPLLSVGLTLSEQLVAPVIEPATTTDPPDEVSEVGEAVVVEITGRGPVATVAEAVAVTFPRLLVAERVKT